MKKEKKTGTPSHSSLPRHSIATNRAPIPIQTWKVRKGHLAPTQNNLLFFLFIFNFFSILFGFSLRFLVLYFAWVKFFEFIKNCKNNNKMIYTVFICVNRQWKDTTPIPCTQTMLVYCWYYELNKIPTANQKTQKLIIDSLSLERERERDETRDIFTLSTASRAIINLIIIIITTKKEASSSTSPPPLSGEN